GDVLAAPFLQDKHILDAHAEAAGEVDTRLGGDDRPGNNTKISQSSILCEIFQLRLNFKIVCFN
ncbi:MAG: hypothetical protein IJ962_06285, partial [Clostridia bacterium]|nr:hypothetical protein [Clostridia bacterium]